MDKTDALRALEAEIEKDASLPLRGQANLVFGEGNPNCTVMFIGEAPGMNEDRERRPFVGRAGQLLRETIRSVGWKETDVYITNIVKRRPPENRDPLPAEIEAYKPYLTRQIDIIAPPVIVPLGRFSMNYFLPEAKITRDQGRVFRVAGPAAPGDGARTGKTLIIPLFHPAAALRAPDVLRAFQESFKKLPGLIARGGAPEMPEAMPGASAAGAAEPEKPKQTKLF